MESLFVLWGDSWAQMSNSRYRIKQRDLRPAKNQQVDEGALNAFSSYPCDAMLDICY